MPLKPDSLYGFLLDCLSDKGWTIRKVMGGWGKKQKKIHARDNAKKKNSCKEEGKEKKFMQKDNPIVTFIYIKFARCRSPCNTVSECFWKCNKIVSDFSVVYSFQNRFALRVNN